MIGRFAPSPTGDLHLGNLRTALVAWWWARRSGGGFLIRMEDLDAQTSDPRHEQSQLRDLSAIGIDWDAPPLRQSARFDLYEDAISHLDQLGLLYRCYCTRREIAEAATAPNGPIAFDGYPGTCRTLSSVELARRTAEGRPFALRLRGGETQIEFYDQLCGTTRGVVDDVVIRRNDGVAAYNLAVVVDDADQGIDLVVRGDDLLASTPRQIHLGRLLGVEQPTYAHVPLVMFQPSGASNGCPGVPRRLAKRDGAVTLGDRCALGDSIEAVVGMLATSVGQSAGGAEAHDATGFRNPAHPYVSSFDPSHIGRDPLILTAEQLASPLPWHP